MLKSANGRADDSVMQVGDLPLQRSIDVLPDPVLAIDRAGTLRYANVAAAQVLEWNPADVIGTSVIHLIPPDAHALAHASLHTIAKLCGNSSQSGEPVRQARRALLQKGEIPSVSLR